MLDTGSVEVSVNLCWMIVWEGKKNKSEPYLVLDTFSSFSSHYLDLSRAKWKIVLAVYNHVSEPVVCSVSNSCPKENLPRSHCLWCSCRVLGSAHLMSAIHNTNLCHNTASTGWCADSWRVSCEPCVHFALSVQEIWYIPKMWGWVTCVTWVLVSQRRIYFWKILDVILRAKHFN